MGPVFDEGGSSPSMKCSVTGWRTIWQGCHRHSVPPLPVGGGGLAALSKCEFSDFKLAMGFHQGGGWSGLDTVDFPTVFVVIYH